MHEGFLIKDWKVERTPINTPDSVIVTNIVPKLSDDEEEVEESDSVSETDPISKGSASSSFLPSSVEVSESRTDKNQTAEMHLSVSAELASVGGVDRVALQSEASSSLVKPPAGFTDSPVRSVPLEFITAGDLVRNISPEFITPGDILCAESEVLVVNQDSDSSKFTAETGGY